MMVGCDNVCSMHMHVVNAAYQACAEAHMPAALALELFYNLWRITLLQRADHWSWIVLLSQMTHAVFHCMLSVSVQE